MAEEPRVIQPLVIIPGPVDPTPTTEDEADRFIENLVVTSDLTFQDWVARNRPLPPMEKSPDAAVLYDDIPD
jgi:hypothetical protein